ncbi:unnamed protein product [Vicia faba]|uniref:AMP deaminase n=1 Tax=Vicia faba TaxID=3906 RepID=A0AAV1AIM2_VICFA|nr:unnamed protein product [Vicia faba]
MHNQFANTHFLVWEICGSEQFNGHLVLPNGENGAIRAPICIGLQRDTSISSKYSNFSSSSIHYSQRVVYLSMWIRTLCYHWLNLLEQQFILHLMLNADKEFLAQNSALHRNFFHVRKVDTHVHLSACMNQKHLLRFINSKLRNKPGESLDFHGERNGFGFGG